MNISSIFHQIMQLMFLANHIKGQMLLIYIGFLEGKSLSNDLMKTMDKDPCSNHTDVIEN